MSTQAINITLGTAGHIDHGKTALVKALTGCETDRLKAEKERGMSIDLGHAPCTIADMQVGIVDVPGHENFVKTMVAGASGMDGVVLVVAADDGVMPQTREHLDILTLLGVRHGLVAMTKIDRVEADHLELALAEMQDFLQGTFLQNAPTLPVSNVTGEGFEPLIEALTALVRGIEPKPVDGVFRVPVDRAFSAKGYGTVVAGIPVAGSARVGDELVLLPRGVPGRIKRLEVYGRESATVIAGQCASLNIGQWEHRLLQRGHTVATPGFFSPQQWFACTLRLLPQERLFQKSAAKPGLKNGARVRLHTGTSEVVAAVYPIEAGALVPGNKTLVQVRAESPLVAAPGDHFIVRSLSPVQTIGGGQIIEPVPKRLKRNRPGVSEDLHQRAEAVRDELQFVEYCVRKAPALAASEEDIAHRAKVPRQRVREILDRLAGQSKLTRLESGQCIHRDTVRVAAQQTVDLIADFHRRSPESPGMTREQLRQSSPLERPLLDSLLVMLEKEARLSEKGGRLALPEHRPTFQEKDSEHLESIAALMLDANFHPPTAEELAEKTATDMKTVERLLKILIDNDRLVRIANGLFFHREAVEKARGILISFLAKEGRLESVKFKYLLDTTRKFAIPLLDYFDQVGVTRRVGNTRYLKDAKSPPATPRQEPKK